MKLFDKFLVVRRDGTVPDWPYLVIGARDPAAPAALHAYAEAAASYDMDPEFIDDILRLADSFIDYQTEYGSGDPDAPAHRLDDPETVQRIKAGSTPDSWRVAK